MNDSPEQALPDMDAMKIALPEVVSAFAKWFQTAERIESGTAAYLDFFESIGSGLEEAPPAFVRFKGGSWVSEWPEGKGWMDFPHYSTAADRHSFVARTLAEAAWWLWVTWTWQDGSVPRETYHAAFEPLRAGK